MKKREGKGRGGLFGYFVCVSLWSNDSAHTFHCGRNHHQAVIHLGTTQANLAAMKKEPWFETRETPLFPTRSTPYKIYTHPHTPSLFASTLSTVQYSNTALRATRTR